MKRTSKMTNMIKVRTIRAIVFFAMLAGIGLLVGDSVNAAPLVTVFTAGVNDNFVSPFEPTSPSVNLLGGRGWNLKDFDDPQGDRVVAHTFTDLPACIVGATLEIHLRAGASSLSWNDGINLTFVGNDQIMPPIGSERWSSRIGTRGTVIGVLPYDWVSPAAFQTVATIILDLGNLPLAGGQPLSAGNLIPALNQHGLLDFWIQDDTDVDYMILTVTSNCVDIDIKPGSCPNPLNVKNKGVLPVAILGTADFDVFDIDVVSIRLEGISPIRSGYEDVATPFEGEICDCHELGADGHFDLTLKFKIQDIVDVLGEVGDGDEVILSIIGKLFDGSDFAGADCVVIIKKDSKRR